MAQELKAFATKPDHLGWPLRTHMWEGRADLTTHTPASYPETNVNKDKSMSSVTGQLCTCFANILMGAS